MKNSISDTIRNKIQVLRGISIVAVVLIHNNPSGLFQVFGRPFLNFSVGMFLFISGMLSDANNWHPRKRIVKVLVPYVIWTFLYVIIKDYHNPSSIPADFFVDIITTESESMMYFVFVYCEFTLLIPLIDKLANSKLKWIGFLISPIEIIVMRMIPIVMGIEINKHISRIVRVSCLGWFIYFYLGYLLGNNLITLNISAYKLGIVLVVVTIIQFLEGYWYYSMGYQNCGTQLKLSAILEGGHSSASCI